MKIAILSRGPELYSTRSLFDAGVRREHDMEVIDPAECYVILEQGKPALMYRNQVLTDIDAIVPRIGASFTFYGSAIVRQFEMMHVFTTTNSQALVRARDKLRSMQLMAREKIGMPATAFARKGAKPEHLIKAVGGAPVVIKLLDGTHGHGVVLAETSKAAKSVIQAFHGLKANFLVQEFVKEAKGADIRAFVVDGKVVGSMRRQGPEGDFRSNLHQGGTAEVYKMTRKEKSTAVKAAKCLGLQVAGVDMLQSDRGPLVMEVNASPGLEGIEKATGVDVASEVIEYIEQHVDVRKRRKKKDKIDA